MLILSRKEGERVMIGENITVTVLKVRGDRITLGFGCPAEVPVHREEVRRRIIESSERRPENQRRDESPYYAEFA